MDQLSPVVNPTSFIGLLTHRPVEPKSARLVRGVFGNPEHDGVRRIDPERIPSRVILAKVVKLLERSQFAMSPRQVSERCKICDAVARYALRHLADEGEIFCERSEGSSRATFYAARKEWLAMKLSAPTCDRYSACDIDRAKDLIALLEQAERTTQELCGLFGMSRSSVQRVVAAARAIRAIDTRRCGVGAYYLLRA